MKLLVAAVVVLEAQGFECGSVVVLEVQEFECGSAVAVVVAAAVAKWAFVVEEQEVAQLLHHPWEVGPSPFVVAGSAVAADATQCLKGNHYLLGTQK